ncbi:MAG: GGDEF domain-containing protein [Actinomycetota bacterium]
MDDEEIAELVEGARASAFVADQDDFLARLDAAIEAADDPTDRGTLLLNRAIARQGQMDPQETADDCVRAFELLRGGSRPGDTALAAAIAAALKHRAGRVDEAIDLAVEALVAAESHPTSEEAARATNALAALFAQLNGFQVAYDLATTAFDTATEPTRKAVAASTAATVTIEAIRAGVDVDIDLLRRTAAHLLETTSDEVAREVIGPGVAAELALLEEDVETMRSLRLRDVLVDVASPRLAAWYRMVVASVERFLGHDEVAIELLDRALPDLIGVGEHFNLIRAYEERSHARRAVGDLDGALDDALELARVIRHDQVDQLGRLATQISARADLEVARVTLHRRANALAEAVMVDALTGVGSRRWLDMALDELAVDTGRVSVAMFDLDRFKAVNDRFGHPAGDAVLQRVGRILDDAARSDDLVARFGGEEFVAVFPGSGREVAVAYAERIRSALGVEPWSEIDPRLGVSISGGVASGQLRDVRTVLEAADRGLYEAKRAGRNRIVAV